ncbi:MAG: hypothetical protein DRH04_10805 [Deltaproteobacteria bacterium]|nr:MAG: hypothetical protein DRH04_10805 [Deltaproteobacteria bacterium]
MKAQYVRELDTGKFLVQVPDDNQWGFRLESDDQAWPGGFGSGFQNWEIVPASRVPRHIRQQLGSLYCH